MNTCQSVQRVGVSPTCPVAGDDSARGKFLPSTSEVILAYTCLFFDILTNTLGSWQCEK